MDRDFRTTKRRWIKIYPQESINGSIRYQLTPSERSVWYDLLLFSSLCTNTGDICDRDGSPFPDSYIANRLNVKTPLLKSTLEKCELEGRITIDKNGIHITNWSKYQSEYDRQKKYRQKDNPVAVKADEIEAERVDTCQQALDRLTDDERENAIETFGTPDTWDNQTWITVCKQLPRELLKD